MSNAKTRAAYDQLDSIANLFGVQADSLGAQIKALSDGVEQLRGGDWVGQGAQAFYAEMDGQVLPALKRAMRALESTQRGTRAVTAEVRSAEELCARILDGGDLAGTPQPAGPTATPQPPAPAATPQPVPVPTPPGGRPTPVSPDTAATPSKPGDRLPPWLRALVDDHDPETDAVIDGSTTGVALLDNIAGPIRAAANVFKVLPETLRMEWQVVGRSLRVTEETLAGVGWEIQRLLVEERVLLKQLPMLDAVPLSFGERLSYAWKAMRAAGPSTGWQAFKELLPEQFSLNNLPPGASNLSRFLKWMPLIGLGLDIGQDAFKYYNRDGWDFYKNPEFYGSVLKDAAYFAVGGLVAAGIGAVAVTVGAPVVVAGAIGAVAVAGLAYAADRLIVIDGKPVSDHVVDFFTDNVAKPVGNWTSNLSFDVPSWVPSF